MLKINLIVCCFFLVVCKILELLVMLFWIENVKVRFILYILLIYYYFYKYKCMYMYL